MKLADLVDSGKVVAIASRLDSARAIEVSKDLLAFFKENKIRVAPESRIAHLVGHGHASMPLHEMHEEQVPVILCVGGDGTILRVAQKLPPRDPPALLGINVGAVGFLAEFDITSKDQYSQLLSTPLVDERCTRLACTVGNLPGNHLPLALNEILVITSRPSKALSISIRVDGQIYSSGYVDGLIVSTPTGSTAYSLSAGGSIMSPELNAVQITPVCPFARTGIKPLVVQPDSHIEIELMRPKLNAILVVDGQYEMTVQTQASNVISIKRSTSSIHFLRTGTLKQSFFSRLGRKLLPGARFPVPKHDQPEE